mgnify:CR=1 FL=1
MGSRVAGSRVAGSGVVGMVVVGMVVRYLWNYILMIRFLSSVLKLVRMGNKFLTFFVFVR